MPSTPPTNPNVFDTPTPQQLSRHLEAYPPAIAAGWQSRLPQLAIIGVGLLVMVTLLMPALMLLPLLGLVILMGYLSRRTRAAIDLQQRVTRTWELAMIRRYRDALGDAWKLLPACRDNPDLHGRVVTVMAHILGELGRDEAAEVAYAYLLDRLPADHPLALRVRVQRASAALREGRLADADDALRRLRGAPEVNDDPTLHAAYTLARLLQDVRTGHFADAVAQATDTAESLKPLGIDAGYGHGLLAYCYHQLAEHAEHAGASDHPPPTDLAQRARLYWHNATLLIPEPALLFRYPELVALTTKIEPIT